MLFICLLLLNPDWSNCQPRKQWLLVGIEPGTFSSVIHCTTIPPLLDFDIRKVWNAVLLLPSHIFLLSTLFFTFLLPSCLSYQMKCRCDAFVVCVLGMVLLSSARLVGLEWFVLFDMLVLWKTHLELVWMFFIVLPIGVLFRYTYGCSL